MFDVFSMAKAHYDAGEWNKAMLKRLVKQKVLTEAQYKEITGED